MYNIKKLQQSKMKLIYIVSSTGRQEFSIRCNPHTIIAETYENPEGIHRLNELLSNMVKNGTRIDAIEVVHYKYSVTDVSIIEFRERLIQILMKANTTLNSISNNVSNNNLVNTNNLNNTSNNENVSYFQPRFHNSNTENERINDLIQKYGGNDLDKLKAYLDTNTHPDFKSSKPKDITKCNNYIQSILGCGDWEKINAYRQIIAHL